MQHLFLVHHHADVARLAHDPKQHQIAALRIGHLVRVQLEPLLESSRSLMGIEALGIVRNMHADQRERLMDQIPAPERFLVLSANKGLDFTCAEVRDMRLIHALSFLILTGCASGFGPSEVNPQALAAALAVDESELIYWHKALDKDAVASAYFDKPPGGMIVQTDDQIAFLTWAEDHYFTAWRISYSELSGVSTRRQMMNFIVYLESPDGAQGFVLTEAGSDDIDDSKALAADIESRIRRQSDSMAQSSL